MKYSVSHVDLDLFVGRDRTLDEMARRFREGRSWILSAGRRFGKTTTLRHLARTADLPVAYVDCQSLGVSSQAGAFFERIGEAVDSSAARPRDIEALERLIESSGRGIAILLDEPDALLKHAWGVPALENVRYLVSNSTVADESSVGLAGGMKLVSRLDSAGSPIANICEEVEIEALNRTDLMTLVLAGFRDPLAAAIEEFVWYSAGGHPYLGQGLLAEIQRSGWPLKPGHMERHAAMLEGVVGGWIDDAGAGGLGPRSDTISLGLRRVRQLCNSGIYRLDDDTLVANGSIVAANLGPGRTRRRGLADCLTTGESATVEFKSSLRWDFRKQQPSKALELEVARAVAAMANSEGGTVLLGVDDQGLVVGVEHDFQTIGKKDLDGWQLKLRQVLNDRLPTQLVLELTIGFEQVDGHTAALIYTPRSEEAIWLHDEGRIFLVVRAGNTSQVLDAREAVEYLGRRRRAS